MKKKKYIAKNVNGLNGTKLKCTTLVKNKFNIPSLGGKIRKKKRNTINFKPDYSIPNMRVLFSTDREKYNHNISNLDVIIVNNLFCKEDDLRIYDGLLKEIDATGIKNLKILWHENSHTILNDRLKWKEKCPIFKKVIKKIKLQ